MSDIIFDLVVILAALAWLVFAKTLPLRVGLVGALSLGMALMVEDVMVLWHMPPWTALFGFVVGFWLLFVLNLRLVLSQEMRRSFWRYTREVAMGGSLKPPKQ